MSTLSLVLPGVCDHLPHEILVGTQLVYRQPGAATGWAVVDWMWPVLDHGAERYERVVLTTAGDAARLSELSALAASMIIDQARAPATPTEA